jgi:hypothetical protein
MLLILDFATVTTGERGAGLVKFHHHVDVRIVPNFCLSMGANNDKARHGICPVREVVAIGVASWERRALTHVQFGFTMIINQRTDAGCDNQEFILIFMPVPQARQRTRCQMDKICAKLRQPTSLR